MQVLFGDAMLIEPFSDPISIISRDTHSLVFAERGAEKQMKIREHLI